MAHVERAALPIDSRLHARRGHAEFFDCYCVDSTLSARKAAEIATTFPGWARLLVALRNIVVFPLGLRTEGPQTDDMLGFFPVEYSDRREVVAGFDDRHLNFRISVLADAGRVYMATWVQPHNLGGRLYLTLILPFHILIVRNALARVARHMGPIAPAT